MLKFKNNRFELLRVLREFVNREMSNAKVNVDLEQDVAEFLTEVTDRRRTRRLKLIRRELDEWISAWAAEKRK